MWVSDVRRARRRNERARRMHSTLRSAALIVTLGYAVTAIGQTMRVNTSLPAQTGSEHLLDGDIRVSRNWIAKFPPDLNGAAENASSQLFSLQNAPMRFVHDPQTDMYAETSSSGSSAPDPLAVDVHEPRPEPTLQECPYDKTHSRACKVHWGQLLISSSLFLAFDNMGNLYTGYYYRQETGTGKWWKLYEESVARYRWDHWSDDNPMLDVYVGHPIMGAITNGLWIQNDPKGAALEQSNTWPYWRSRLRATAFTTLYSMQWKVGPLGELGFGHSGSHYFPDHGVLTNETGDVELVTTPVGGLAWTLAEDYLDKHVLRRLEEKSRNPFFLLGIQFMNPARGTANILRFRPPWYRDSRVVKASSFFSDPGEGVPAAIRGTSSGNIPAPPYGGTHEFGLWWGLSLFSGSLWGDEASVKYMPIDLRYSRLLTQHDHWALRYSPELTALAMLDEVDPGQTDPRYLRRRTYGSGLSPEGFQVDFRPQKRVQPFLGHNAGFVFFVDPVLSQRESRLVYTIDFGGGINIFRKARQALTLGYRYQHLASANFSSATDANTFYVGVSRFRSKGD